MFHQPKVSKDSKPLGLFWLAVFLLIGSFNFASSQTIVKTLPGYNGTLPFTLETGYIGVGDDGTSQLFYYFIESERDPENDPLLLWHAGGPGCSGFYSLVYEHIGPLSFDVEAYNGGLPSLLLNQYAWTKVANIIFLDSPVGTGFSYSTVSEDYTTSDTKIAADTYEFLRKWLLNHPDFLKNRLYIGGDSFGGKIVPLVATQISRGNDASLMPSINFKGYVIENPSVGLEEDNSQRIEYAHHLGLISNQYYKLAISSCNGEYDRPDPRNHVCIDILEVIQQCTNDINQQHILEPYCGIDAPKPDEDKPSPRDDLVKIRLLSETEESSLQCRDNNYVPASFWTNDAVVQEALQIRKDGKTHWVRCNKGISCKHDIISAFPNHVYLSGKNIEALVYSGDHDMGVPYLSTLNWIQKLNLPLRDNWRPWFVSGQVAGYTEKYQKNKFSLTFATVKGAGHTAPEYLPKECFNMIDRWFSGNAL